MNDDEKRILLVGAGTMAVDYAKVFDGLEKPYVVVGRGDRSAKLFESKTQHDVTRGGINQFLEHNEDNFENAVVAVRVNQLHDVAFRVLQSGVKNVLIEKPGSMTKNELEEIKEYAEKNGQSVYIAYNRRFYSSVIEAKKSIEEDGGVTSFSFEFTEWSHVIEHNEVIPEIEKKIWFFANSSHVVDLAFYLGGKPKVIQANRIGGMDWHPESSIFCGSGISERGALFSYQANWKSPGRWGVEVMTSEHRYIFRPLEKLQIQNNGSVNIELVKIDDDIDTKFKPGLFMEMVAFLGGEGRENLCSIDEQINNIDYYEKISGEHLI